MYLFPFSHGIPSRIPWAFLSTTVTKLDAIRGRPLSRITPRRLAREFKRGLSMVGLARKYALTQRQVEDWIRSVARLEEPDV